MSDDHDIQKDEAKKDTSNKAALNTITVVAIAFLTIVVLLSVYGAWFNPDIIAATIKDRSETQKHVIAGRHALRQQAEFLNARRSFIVETTFSGRAGFNLINKAVESGYKVNFVYVALKSYRQSQGRVYTRISDGGHNVPAVDIKRRFNRITDNIDAILPKVDRAFVLDNTRRAPLLVAKLKRGKLVRKYPTLAKWLQERFPTLKKSKSQLLSR